MRPDTKAMGSKAAMTVKVASIVGPPTSSTACGMASPRRLAPRARCLWMFSTTTIASSTRIPMEKIRANRETRLMVKPQAHEANRVMARVTTTAAPTTRASRQPMAIITSRMTEPVANASLLMSFVALASAVSP